jgi:glucosamine--fructose-6-phosphate aminotransferase (isomerizing)
VPAVASQLEREIREQGDVLAARTSSAWESAERAADALRRADVDYAMIAARGTSDNAARYAQYLLGVMTRLPVGLATPWLYSSDTPPLLSRGALIAISQSGRSPDIVGVMQAARAQARPTIALTNDVASPLARATEIVVPLLAGEERSVAATKSYLASLHAIAQIAACLRPDLERTSWFERLPGLVSAAVEEQLAQRSRFDPLDGATLLTVIGRGLELASAHETALKVRELSGIPAEAFSLPDLIHGPIAALQSSGAIWTISTSGHHQPDRATLEQLRAVAGISVVVSDNADLLSLGDISIEMQSGLPQWVAPILAVIPAQAAALRLGERRGVNLDHPRGLTKVTLTS